MAGSIVELVRAQRALYEELLGLCVRQRELVREADGASVLEIIERRGAIIERLTALQEEADARGGIDACLGRDPDAVEEVEAHRARVAEIGAQIAQADADDIASLRAASGDVASELGRVGSGRRAVDAYGGAAASAGVARFQDKRA